MKTAQKEQIQTQAKKLNAAIQTYLEADNDLQTIEKDLILHYLRILYDQIRHIETDEDTDNKRPDNFPKEISPERETEATITTTITEDKENEEINKLQRQLKEMKEKFALLQQEPTNTELKDNGTDKHINPDVSFDNGSLNNAAKETKSEVEEKSKNSLAESFEDQKDSVNDVMSQKIHDSSIADTFSKNRIKDLKSVIDINQKFLFINDLFDGNADDYRRTIEAINNAGKFDDIIDLLNQMRRKYNWLKKEETFRIFNDLIHRKF
jgi:hypothetical protein